jgi:pyridoxal phosphate enzyme (YggS family)
MEIAANLAAVRARLDSACRRAGRSPDEVTLVAVTKTRPAEDVLHLAALGVVDIGENRDQEAAPKAAAVRAAGVAVRWHFVGHLQRNKCASVVRYADLVHSVDSVRLATALAEAAGRHREAPLDVLVQVSLDGDPSRGGAVDGDPDSDVGLEAVLATVAGAERLRLRGLMAVAPLEWEPARAFERLAGVAHRVRAEYPDATILSAGMSGDAEEAIHHGATHVRLGSALLGDRAPLM